MSIGTTIKQLRQEQDITQEQLADALGITSRAVSQWETDRTAPDISQLPALANFFDVTTDFLLGVDIRRKEEEVDKILKQVNKYQEQGDQLSTAEYLREQLKIYPNEPDLLTELAFALRNYYFVQGKADTEELKKEKSDEIIALCERALKYYKPTDDNNFTKQVLIGQYVYYLHDKEKGEKLVMSLPNVYCTRERFLADLYEGKEALARRQSALLWSMTQMMHRLFWEISRDDSYTYEQRIEILKADDALTELITGGKPNFFHGKLSVNAAVQAELYLKLGDKEKSLDMLWSAYDHADSYENRSAGAKYSPCWLSEMDDDQIKVLKMDPNTAYDSIYNIIAKPENKFCEAFEGDPSFNALIRKLKAKITK
ncbi:helix-turn-helix transcriptional regulator [Ruminococcus sp. NK3A76]|uniref:helix-turn-helix domain-containing protein n=1 Tax=Ruminococcus sp. NK3A76 TaxID=877411 RepID=UPI00048EB011|nr:helix-turn-helix transcriptional regulator [Ruminococcus sp. NK3A76]